MVRSWFARWRSRRPHGLRDRNRHVDRRPHVRREVHQRMTTPVRGIEACFESLRRRAKWVEERSGGSFDRREAIALKYGVALLEAAEDLDLISILEDHALARGKIRDTWMSERSVDG